MSESSRLVAHMNRFESKIPNLRICVTSFDSISSFYEVQDLCTGRTFVQGVHNDGVDVVSPGSKCRSLKHPTSASPR